MLPHSTSHSARATGAPTARAATKPGSGPTVGPEQHGQQGVEDDRARAAGHRAVRGGQHAAQAFTEPPHGQ